MYSKIWKFCFVAIFIAACSGDDEVKTALTDYDRRVIEYFPEVALGFEFGGASEVTRKWGTDMKIFIGGTKSPELINELLDVITEINSLATDGFSISVVDDSLQMNYYVFLGPGSEYAAKYPSQSGLVGANWGLFNVYWNGADLIYSGNMYVDIARANDQEEKHLLREELTQSLGLARDSERYDNSIFQSAWTTTTEYADIDRDLIRLLYHAQMPSGLGKAQVEELLTEIILDEK